MFSLKFPSSNLSTPTITSTVLSHLTLGTAFIVLDIISGPLSVAFNIYNWTLMNPYTITVADILLLLRIFCLEKIRCD